MPRRWLDGWPLDGRLEMGAVGVDSNDRAIGVGVAVAAGVAVLAGVAVSVGFRVAGGLAGLSAGSPGTEDT